MKNLLNYFKMYLLIWSLLFAHGLFAQEQIRQDYVQVGRATSVADKGFKFDLGDGASNPTLMIEDATGKLKYDKNIFQIGGSSGTDNKDFIFNGDNKKIRYNGTANSLEYDGDHVSIGDGTNTIKTLKFNKGASSPEIRYNTATSKLEFTNNAVDYKAIGSGSGSGSGGIQLLENDSFEDGVSTFWTNSGGTFTQQTYTNGTEGDVKYARFVASGAAQYFETTTKAIPDNFGAGCQADFKKYNTVTASAFKIEAMDSAGTTIYATQTLAAATWLKAPAISFPCPVAGTLVKLRVTSLSAATIEVDRAYLGSNQNLVYTSQAKLLGSIKYAATALCNWQTTSTSFANFAADTDCPTASVTGSASAPGTKIPAIVFSSLPAGDYYLVATAQFRPGASATASAQHGRFSDGTNFSAASSLGDSGTGATANISGRNNLIGKLSYGVAQSNVTIQLQALTTAAGSPVTIDTSTSSDFEIQVYYYPAVSEVAVSNEQLNWFIDVNIGGANPTGIAASAYTEITSASLDMVLNSGSATAQIPCSTTNPSTGLTCAAGSESVGVAFTPPNAGRYKVCAYFGGNDANGTAAYELIETPNNAQTLLQEGNSRLRVTTTTSPSTPPQTNCGYFNFSDTSLRTIRLMEESNSTGVTITADRGAAVGQPDIHITVENMSFPQNRPILTGDTVTTGGAAKPIMFSFLASSAGVVSQDYGDYINGNGVITATSTFTYTLNGGKVGSAPNCTMIPNNIGSNHTGSVDSASTTTIVTHTKIPGTGESAIGHYVLCHALAP